MNSQTLIRFSKSTSYLVIFVLFPLLHHLPWALSKQEGGWCEAPFQCGEITAGFPFWGANRPEHCGLPQLELHCRDKSSTYLINSDQEYFVLKVGQSSYTLTLARADQLGPLCGANFSTTALPPDIFEILPAYKDITIYYLCDPKHFSNNSYACPRGKGLLSVTQIPGYGESYCSKSFTVNVPKSYVVPVDDDFDLYEFESVIRKGFEVKVKIDEITCQECSSSSGICSFNGAAQVCCKTNSPSRVICEPKRQRSAAEIYRLCRTPFFCGNQGGLLYPFWIPGREECGHPDFKLDCNGGFAELNISSVNFRILAVNYGTSIIRLARSTYIGSLCPKDPLDTPFLLPFASYAELLTFYSNCTVVCSISCNSSIYFGNFNCVGTYNGVYYYVTRNLSSPLLQGIGDHLYDLRVGCRTNFSIPTSGPALNRLQNNNTMDNLMNALEDGFQVRLDQECLRCTDSGGACGYNHITKRFVCYHTGNSRNKGISSRAKIGSGASVILFMFLVLALGLRIFRKRKPSHDLCQRNLKTLNPLKQYSFAEVKRITKSFTEMIGKGGFGTVYRGTLSDGRMVAVKILNDSKSNGEDFINEVASMSKTSHVNIVTLLGFCAEGTKRAILYEFLENGSLDQFISTTRSSNKNWIELYGIALGIARGLEYLHHGCRTRIVHFDIKPQNVLLDDNLCPKVSDFGLAKLCERKESMLSLLDTRGTIGYIAPEVFSRVYGRVSHKSDVYSYGMLVLEMIGARTKTSTEDTSSSTSSMYFPEWIYRDLEEGDNGRLLESGINSEEEEEIAKKMTLVGLWCIQAWPSNRPPMNRVIEMMEGNLNALEFPPRPAGLQIPTAPLPDSSTLSNDISISEEYDPECSIKK